MRFRPSPAEYPVRVPGGATRINERTNAGRPVAGFRVHKGGRSLGSWRSNRAKGVLKLLIVHQGRQVPKDLLIEAFWPGYPVRAASNSLRVAIHELRQRLDLLHDGPSPPKYVLSQGKNYFINMEAAIWVDVDEFEALRRAGRSLERSGRLDEAVDTYRRAEALYTGDFLEEDPYEDWASLRREALLDVYLSILSKVVAHHMKAGDYATCIEYSQKLLAKDRCREDAYQCLITCHTKLGQRSRAIRWYSVCEETLRRELDCPVSPETEALYCRMVHGSGV